MKLTHLAGIGAVALIVAMGTSGALAQEGRRYATGATPTPAERLAELPEAPVYRDFLPQAVDLSRYMPAVGDQLNQGSCVGWATAYAARAYYAYQVEHRDITDTANIPSPAWIFNIIHLGNDCNQGSYVPDAMDVLRTGARSLKEYPYDDTKCPMPLPPQRARATDFSIESYELVWNQADPQSDIDTVKGALASGHPVVVTAALDAEFFNLNPRQSIWRSNPDKANEGGHAFTLVGYDDATQTFKFINSWNTSWGDEGYGRMTYDTFKARVWEGHIMHMAGDPQIALNDEDFVADVIDATPPPPPFQPPLIVTPSEDVATRDLGGELELGELACGKVEFGTDAEGNSTATGFVGSEEEMARVQNALMDKVDTVDLTLAPWPACEVRLTLDAPLAETDVPQVAVAPDSPAVGDALNIGIETPGFPSYLYAAYFAADGNVMNLAQPSSADLRPKAGHTIVRFGDSEGGQISLTVAPPVGEEMLVVVSSEKPLFAAARPDAETYREFLSALRTGVLSGEAGRVTASIVPVTTTE
ncbi:MAG TPA: C1 family peptidase [Devosia sp.]|nr:C1 family peptidase [Devosia sp.]